VARLSSLPRLNEVLKALAFTAERWGVDYLLAGGRLHRWPTTQIKQEHIRIGVDLGGTKIEFVALERDGRELHRHRIATPRFDYEGTVRAITEAVTRVEKEIGRSASVGMGIPGTISRRPAW